VYNTLKCGKYKIYRYIKIYAHLVGVFKGIYENAWKRKLQHNCQCTLSTTNTHMNRDGSDIGLITVWYWSDVVWYRSDTSLMWSDTDLILLKIKIILKHINLLSICKLATSFDLKKSSSGLILVWCGLISVWYWSDIGLLLVWYRSDTGLTSAWYQSDTGLISVWHWSPQGVAGD
jgi:hypothetical protein